MKIESEDKKISKMSEVIEDSLKIEAYSEKITENAATTQLYQPINVVAYKRNIKRTKNALSHPHFSGAVG